MTAVHVITNTTAAPRPRDDLTSLDMDRKGQRPRKFVRRMLFVKMAAKKSVPESI
jgi:hypothetical protein